MSDPDRVRLFSYGTLQQERVQIATFGRLLHGAADVLPGHRQSLVEVTDPGVIATSGTNLHPSATPSPDPNDAVAGLVFEITAAELAAADGYEAPSGYGRKEVSLASGLKAWVYVKL